MVGWTCPDYAEAPTWGPTPLSTHSLNAKASVFLTNEQTVSNPTHSLPIAMGKGTLQQRTLEFLSWGLWEGLCFMIPTLRSQASDFHHGQV